MKARSYLARQHEYEGNYLAKTPASPLKIIIPIRIDRKNMGVSLEVQS